MVVGPLHAHHHQRRDRRNRQAGIVTQEPAHRAHGCVCEAIHPPRIHAASSSCCSPYDVSGSGWGPASIGLLMSRMINVAAIGTHRARPRNYNTQRVSSGRFWTQPRHAPTMAWTPSVNASKRARPNRRFFLAVAMCGSSSFTSFPVVDAAGCKSHTTVDSTQSARALDHRAKPPPPARRCTFCGFDDDVHRPHIR